jgi:hypothetical protein
MADYSVGWEKMPKEQSDSPQKTVLQQILDRMYEKLEGNEALEQSVIQQLKESAKSVKIKDIDNVLSILKLEIGGEK